MARFLYGNRPADFTSDSNNKPVPNFDVEVWDSLTGGTRITDLLLYQPADPSTPGDLADNGYFKSQSDGTVLVWGPDTYRAAMYIAGKDQGGGHRWLIEPVLADRLATLEDGVSPAKVENLADVNIAARADQTGLLWDAAQLEYYHGSVQGATGPEGPPAPPRYTVDDVLADSPFYVAHRGSQDNFPEHTLLSYTGAAGYGAKAVEVSVRRTRDGLFICHHDTTTARLTGTSMSIATTAYARLSTLENNAQEWLGPNTPTVGLTRLNDVLDRLAGRVVIFIEEKDGLWTDELLDLMDSYPNSTQTFVWKTYRSGNGSAAAAQARGYKAWGYLDADDPNLDSVAAIVDMLGVPVEASDTFIQAAVAKGKPVMAWPVHRRSDRDRLVSLGVQGMMCAGLPYVTTNLAYGRAAFSGYADMFSDGVKAPGDIPWNVAQPPWGWQPAWVTDGGNYVLSLDNDFNQAYLMGSLSPIPEDTYNIEFEVKWADSLPGGTERVGIAFCRSTDEVWRFGLNSSIGGYHFQFGPDGGFRLSTHLPNNFWGGVLLGSQASAAPVLDTWIPFRISVSPTGISVARTDISPNPNFSTPNTDYRGKYIHITKNHDGHDVRFRNVSVTPV